MRGSFEVTKLFDPSVLMGTDPEEVAKWREERRSRYPTKVKKEKKVWSLPRESAEGAQRKEREEKSSGARRKKARATEEITSTCEVEEGECKSSPYIDDEDPPRSGEPPSQVSTSVPSSDANPPSSKKGKSQKKPNFCKYFKKGICKKGEKCLYRHELPSNNAHSKNGKTRAQGKAQGNLSFLNKLVEKDRDEEYYYLLQCFILLDEDSAFDETPDEDQQIIEQTKTRPFVKPGSRIAEILSVLTQICTTVGPALDYLHLV